MQCAPLHHALNMALWDKLRKYSDTAKVQSGHITFVIPTIFEDIFHSRRPVFCLHSSHVHEIRLFPFLAPTVRHSNIFQWVLKLPFLIRTFPFCNHSDAQWYTVSTLRLLPHIKLLRLLSIYSWGVNIRPAKHFISLLPAFYCTFLVNKIQPMIFRFRRFETLLRIFSHLLLLPGSLSASQNSFIKSRLSAFVLTRNENLLQPLMCF